MDIPIVGNVRRDTVLQVVRNRDPVDQLLLADDLIMGFKPAICWFQIGWRARGGGRKCAQWRGWLFR